MDRELTLVPVSDPVDEPVDTFELKVRLDTARDCALELGERLALSVKDRPWSHYSTVALADLVAAQMRLVHTLRREYRAAVSG